MNAPNKLEVPQEVIEFQLNGKTVEAFDGESILNAAKRVGVAIPHLCYMDGLRADGNCRACVVEVKGERVLAPSCCRAATSHGSHHQFRTRRKVAKDGARIAVVGHA